MIVLVAFATFVATLIGGALAIRFKDKLHLVLGFSAGAVIGVAFFDLLPESIEMGEQFFSVATITTLVAVGFVAYMIFDRTIALVFKCKDSETDTHGAHHRGTLGAGSLSVHSFLDGVAIGLSFQVSAAVGLVVAIAVLAHDFSDGMNTVNMIFRNNGSKKRALRWLFVDALAPVLGAASTLFFTLPEQSLSIILALFTGFFLYIGASDLVPESHHAHPQLLTTVMTVLGILTLYGIIQLAHL